MVPLAVTSRPMLGLSCRTNVTLILTEFDGAPPDTGHLAVLELLERTGPCCVGVLGGQPTSTADRLRAGIAPSTVQPLFRPLGLAGRDSRYLTTVAASPCRTRSTGTLVAISHRVRNPDSPQ